MDYLFRPPTAMRTNSLTTCSHGIHIHTTCSHRIHILTSCSHGLHIQTTYSHAYKFTHHLQPWNNILTTCGHVNTFTLLMQPWNTHSHHLQPCVHINSPQAAMEYIFTPLKAKPKHSLTTCSHGIHIHTTYSHVYTFTHQLQPWNIHSHHL